MNLNLANRVALVAGSSRGIGLSIAAALLAEGARVCLTGRDTAALHASANSLRAATPAAQILEAPGDLTDAATIAATIAAIQQHWGQLDILVANLGSGSGQSGWQVDEAEWQRLFNLNFFASTRLAQAAIPAMPNGGSILFISSIAGVEGTGAPLPYSAAKAALLSYNKNLARVVTGKNIRVNAIAPGNILFPGGSWERHRTANPDRVAQYIAAEVPQNRFGTPDEIAALATFLCGDAAAFSTGACYVMDGGQTRSL
jgi:3-oxoacyl-[acyl-carrier protein] reductase